MPLRFKNERLPNVVVTVDLLTTGIDVPPITNLVFLRRIQSRILYDQMLGVRLVFAQRLGKHTLTSTTLLVYMTSCNIIQK